MDVTRLKEKLHLLIDESTDGVMLEQLLRSLDHSPSVQLSGEQLRELDARILSHELGKTTYFSTSEMLSLVRTKK